MKTIFSRVKLNPRLYDTLMKLNGKYAVLYNSQFA
jgi:hypothetical protein